MAYGDAAPFLRFYGRDEISGKLAIRLAEQAHGEGRIEEARGLVELAYRLFDEAADVDCSATLARKCELYPA